jgi:hypothetical protein
MAKDNDGKIFKKLSGNIDKDTEGSIMLLFVVGWTIGGQLFWHAQYFYCYYY